MLLGEMGADVIKVERHEGDWKRNSDRGEVEPFRQSAVRRTQPQQARHWHRSQ
jgi:crotonobetainyl-CoA:carnitine CoA-transferase CaiB-like acyl-CoA transferase